MCELAWVLVSLSWIYGMVDSIAALDMCNECN